MSRDIVVTIGAYDQGSGIEFVWEDGFVIDVTCDKGESVIRANRSGLVSLARHLLTMAEDDVPIGSHIHLAAGQELEDSSIDLILERS